MKFKVLRPLSVRMNDVTGQFTEVPVGKIIEFIKQVDNVCHFVSESGRKFYTIDHLDELQGFGIIAFKER